MSPKQEPLDLCLDVQKKIKEIREKISNEICTIIDEATDPWGIKVENVELKDIKLPAEMQRVIAKIAEAEREKEAVITKSRGEEESATHLANAASIMASTPGALHLRTLATLNDLSSDQSNTIIFAIPIEVLSAFGTQNISKDKVVEAVKKITNNNNNTNNNDNNE